MKKTILFLILFLCSCNEKDISINKGKKLFNKVHIGKNNVIGCISCHSLKPEIKTVGPSLYAIGLRAGLLVKDQSAKQYLKQSIINPDAYIVSGYTPAVMFAHYQVELNDNEINDLVNFLYSLYAK